MKSMEDLITEGYEVEEEQLKKCDQNKLKNLAIIYIWSNGKICG